MKLLIITQVLDKNHPILGFFHRWVEEFSRKFEEVHVICLQKGTCDLPENVVVYSLGKEEGRGRFVYLWRFYKYFSYIFFTVKVNHVFFHMGAIFNILATPFFLLRKLYKTKFYWWKTHGHIGIKERISLLVTDRVYSASSNSFPVASEKKHVSGHAIEIPVSEMQENRVGVLFVGRLMPVKNIEQVLQIASLFLKDGIEIPVSIVGPTPDLDYLEKLQTIVKDSGLGNIVTFVGPVTPAEVKVYYKKFSILVNPSDTDSIDKVVLEGMTYGIVPVTHTKAFKDMLEPYGLFSPKDDIYAMYEIILRVLDLTREERVLLEKKLGDIVSQNHSLSTLPKRIFNI